MKLKMNRLTFGTAALVAAGVSLIGCDRDPVEKEGIEPQQVVEAEELAEGEGIADPDAEREEPMEIAQKLLLTGDEDLFDGFDANRDNYISVEEFEPGAERVNLFGMVDVNENKVVTEDEFHNALFSLWDTNGDGAVGEREYVQGALRFFTEDTEELENYADIDANDDALLQRGEFVANMDGIALFDRWDLDDDAEMGADEMMMVIQNIWDTDRDLRVSKTEFGGSATSKARSMAVAADTAERDSAQGTAANDSADDSGAAAKTGATPEVAGVAVVGARIIPTEMRPITNEKLFAEPVPVGRMVTGTFQVDEVISDRGFWIGEGENRVFAVVREDVPKHEMIDIDKGQSLKLTGYLVPASAASNLTGTLEKDTTQAIEKEGAFLAMHHKQVKIVDGK